LHERAWLEEKLQVRMQNGVRRGFLVEPDRQRCAVCRTQSGGEVMPGLELGLRFLAKRRHSSGAVRSLAALFQRNSSHRLRSRAASSLLGLISSAKSSSCKARSRLPFKR